MNADDNSKLLMAKTTNGTLTKNTSIFSGNASFVTHKGKLVTQIALCDAANAAATTSTTGVAEDKSDLRILLENKVDILIGNVCTYALTVNNNTLYNKFYFSLSGIEQMGGSDIINFSTTLLAEIALNTANYVGVGMDPVDVTDATTDLANFSAALVSPRVAGTTQSANNNDAHNQVQLLTPLCIVLDNFMRPYRQKKKVL